MGEMGIKKLIAGMFLGLAVFGGATIVALPHGTSHAVSGQALDDPGPDGEGKPGPFTPPEG